MKDELKEIEQIPEFSCSIDPRTLASIQTQEARDMAIYLDKEMQRSRYVERLVLDAYNLSVRNENFRRKYGFILHLVYWIGGLIVMALVAKYGAAQ